MKRGVDVISPAQRTVMTLQSLEMSAIPSRFDAHPYEIGMLAGATSGGQVYLWPLISSSIYMSALFLFKGLSLCILCSSGIFRFLTTLANRICKPRRAEKVNDMQRKREEGE
ncbi:hypothetical protein V6N13_078526 [Hibiscus sabdariffa]|uniref:Uncharacterized protein n=1 Tax=Hibiscus sabdariffa TaxID=183260 RepID=A0ABR2RP26_9ROSI